MSLFSYHIIKDTMLIWDCKSHLLNSEAVKWLKLNLNSCFLKQNSNDVSGIGVFITCLQMQLQNEDK